MLVEKTENSAHKSMILPSTDVVILVGFELSIDGARGAMDLCIPSKSIEKIDVFSTTDQAANQTSDTRQNADDSTCQLVVTLAESKIASEDLANLQIGDIITTEKFANELLDVKIDGATQFRASAGALNGHKAIQVQEVVD
jgi:flagellar motor switch protein FliM